MANRKQTPITMWAVIICNTRCEWIHSGSISRTRNEAWRQYRDNWLPSTYAKLDALRRSGELRLARVTIAEQE